MEKELLEKIHKFDNDDIKKKYHIDLWSIVYMLLKRKYIKYNNSIYDLQKIYSKEYQKTPPKDSWSSIFDTNKAIEQELYNLWLIDINNDKTRLTESWIKTIEYIYTDVNWTKKEKLMKKIEQPIYSFVIILLTLIASIVSIFISIFK